MDNKYKNEDLKTVVEHEIKDSSKRSDRNVEDVVNGSMAPDMDEMKQLGKDMNDMKTNQTLKQEGLVPDPIQDDEEE
jgi:hypothetical protein